MIAFLAALVTLVACNPLQVSARAKPVKTPTRAPVHPRPTPTPARTPTPKPSTTPTTPVSTNSLQLGFSAGELVGMSAADIATTLDRYQAAGGTVIRFDLDWARVQPTGPGELGLVVFGPDHQCLERPAPDRAADP